MEVDSPSELVATVPPRERILQRLSQLGVRGEQLDELQPGLVSLVKERKLLLPELISKILPTDSDAANARITAEQESDGESSKISTSDLFCESSLWLQWLMFENEPRSFLNSLSQKAMGQRAVCGAVWGHSDLAYRCRTCEHDPTCAICVSCFQNGNHKDHDYSIMYTGGGCCDCGDITAWKREGFCSKHKGVEQIQPLPVEVAGSAAPVLDALLVSWKDRLLPASNNISTQHEKGNDNNAYGKYANELSFMVVGMLLEFCNCSESLLNFIAKAFISSIDLLDILVRAEMFLEKSVVMKLNELLLKLLGEPLFKYEFAKVFIGHYTTIINEIIRENSDSVFDKYPSLATFSVQIFTVPTLTPRLVREVNLLAVLLECLWKLFRSCVDTDGCLEAKKWANVYETTIRLVEDTRYVMSHNEVPKYVAREWPDASKHWIRMLELVHGVDPQKRLTGIHTEEENENLLMPFVLGFFLQNVQSLFVDGAFSSEPCDDIKSRSSFSAELLDTDDGDRQRHAKVGRVSQESSVSESYISSRSACLISAELDSTGNHLFIPPYVASLFSWCIKALDRLLATEVAFGITLSPDSGSSSGCNILGLQDKLFRSRKDGSSSKIRRSYSARTDQLRGSSVAIRTYGKHDLGAMKVTVGDFDIGLSSGTLAYDVNSTNMDSGTDPDALNVLSIVDWPEIVFDVSSQEISFHIPLHRFLTLLFQKVMSKHYGEDGALGNRSDNHRLPLLSHCHEFFQLFLRNVHPSGFSAFVMEHPLRLRVFCAQVHAGMWHKNGEGGFHISEWYHAVRWFGTGIESDLFLLQCCAALAPAELFVRRIQERFGLLKYLSLDLTERSEYEPVLVKEMLTLIIQIVADRRFCGLSRTENLCRELVYKLAIGDATRSQLVKSLPRDLSKNDQVQEIIDRVAVYSNPSELKQGKYSLHKAYWKELDLYHPRWNSRDLQGAEERYLRFCKVSALNAQLPQWTKVFDPLSSLCRIPISRAVLHMVRAVFFYAVYADPKSVSRPSDGVLVTALHLLSLALDVCDKCTSSDASISSVDDFPVLRYANEKINLGTSRGLATRENESMLSLLVSLMMRYRDENENGHSDSRLCDIALLTENLLKKLAHLNSDCMDELKKLAPHVVCNVHQENSEKDTVLVSDAKLRKAKARERQAAILEKMKAEQSKFIASLKTESDGIALKSVQEVSKNPLSQEDSTPICSLCRDSESKSPVSFLVLLQKSRLSSFVDRGPPAWDETIGAQDEHISSSKGKLIGSELDSSSPEGDLYSRLLQMLRSVEHELMYDLHPTEIVAPLDVARKDARSTQLLNSPDRQNTDIASSLIMMENELYLSILEDVCNMGKFSSALASVEKGLVSLAGKDLTASKDTETATDGKLITSLTRETSKRWTDPSHMLCSSSESTIKNALFERFGPANCDGIYISSCGHVVHQECHDSYLCSMKQRHSRRPGFEGGHIVDPDMGELLCPVCRRFANSILPMCTENARMIKRYTTLPDGDNNHTSISGFESELDKSSLYLSHAVFLLRSTAKKVGQVQFFRALSGNIGETIEPALEPVLRKLCGMYFPSSYDRLSASGHLSYSLLLWDTLRYSLTSTEIAARGKTVATSDGMHSGLQALYGEFRSSNGFILSLLLQAAHASRSLNHLQVLMRFSGIEILAASICSDLPSCRSHEMEHTGPLSTLMECLRKEEVVPDLKFLKQAADPILAHDPFSSLLWVLFCLPLPFASSSQTFLALVHLFHVVCVVQALITCHSKLQFDNSDIADCPVNDICRTMGKSELAQKFFVSNHLDSSVRPKDMVRRITFPFLRRCSLLWKMLKSLTSMPVYDKAHMWDKLTPYMYTNMLENTDNIAMELSEISELENTFQINSLEEVLNDKLVSTLALKWCTHFSEVFSIRKFECILYSTPAIPFRLMRLPFLYQDLLQRYIKQQCPECKAVPVEPALCLLCGRLCSPSWKPCCRASKCQHHAMACGAGVGIFLLIRRTTIILQRSARQASWPSPYLDAFGEEDLDMQRGKPLYLSDERYSAMAYLVASHGIDQNTVVLRQTTVNMNGY